MYLKQVNLPFFIIFTAPSKILYFELSCQIFRSKVKAAVKQTSTKEFSGKNSSDTRTVRHFGEKRSLTAQEKETNEYLYPKIQKIKNSSTLVLRSDNLVCFFQERKEEMWKRVQRLGHQ